jgi:hypothetical protein
MINFDMTFDPSGIAIGEQLVENKIIHALVELAESVYISAKNLSPVGTPASTGIRGYQGGTNRKSITVDFYDFGGLAKTFSEVGNPSETDGEVPRGSLGFRICGQSGYSAWLELGTNKMRPRPYIAPSYINETKRLESVLEGIL